MAEKLFGVLYNHLTVPQLEVFLKKTGIDYDGTKNKATLFTFAQGFERNLQEHNRREVERVLVNLVEHRRRLNAEEEELGFLLTRVSAGEDIGTPDEVEEEQKKTCEVCLEDLSLDEFPNRNITETCDHEPYVCLEHLRDHIRVQMEDRPIANLSCPLCEERLTAEDVQVWATEELFIAYCKKALTEHLQNEPNFLHCLGPGCVSGQIVDELYILPYMLCDVCSFITCIRHQIPYHNGQTCDEYDLWKAELDEGNAASAEELRNNTRPCPQCHSRIFRDDGCDYMICGRCNTEFCWKCGLLWETLQGREPVHGHLCNAPVLGWHLDPEDN